MADVASFVSGIAARGRVLVILDIADRVESRPFVDALTLNNVNVLAALGSETSPESHESPHFPGLENA